MLRSRWPSAAYATSSSSIDSGAVTGVVSERDLFALQRLSVRELVSDIRRARDLPALRRTSADVRALAYALVAHGVASRQLTRMISSLNDQMLRRVLDLVAPRHALGDLTLCWIGMGSEGRSEQTIATDQDNGLVFVATGTTPPDAVRERMLPFAREVNEALDALGYPLCKGGVMAMNARWCASLAEWQASFEGWIERGDPESLLASSIFFDFRPLWGEAGLAHALRRDVATRAEANPRFLKQMTDNALRNRPPLNWFGELRTRTRRGEHRPQAERNGARRRRCTDPRARKRCGGDEHGGTARRRQRAARHPDVRDPRMVRRFRVPADDPLADAAPALDRRACAVGQSEPGAARRLVGARPSASSRRRCGRSASSQQRLALDYPG